MAHFRSSLRDAYEHAPLEPGINRRPLDDTLRIVLNGLTDIFFIRRMFKGCYSRAS